jgi:predicted SnoaL-like aldol condensation-catalyzing enzyme
MLSMDSTAPLLDGQDPCWVATKRDNAEDNFERKPNVNRVIATVGLALALAGSGSLAMAQESVAEAQNKQIVLKFYEKALNAKNAEAAVSYFGSHYTQHNPGTADGIEGFRKFIEYLRQNYPQAHSEPKHVFADGNYVIIHSHAIREPGTRGAAVVDIFRLEDRKIVEHWDIIQPVPETAANSNGMF